MGLAYQHKVEKFLRRELIDVQVGKWIEFYDANGSGYAQPDVFIVGPWSVVLLESKLKETQWGHAQIDHLYRPLLRYIFGRPVVGIMACKFIQFTPEFLISHPAEVLDETTERTYIWHWLG
jgi:hypothetical protein